MTAPEAPAPSGPSRSSSEPLSTLRGAGVNYDARKVGWVAVGLCLVTLAVLVVIFTVAGVHRNSQINRLHHDGVPVTVTVTHCLALMGGSGSNAAGYSCSGTFTVHGRHFTESLPGTSFHAVGSSLPAIVVPNDPALVSPVGHRTGPSTRPPACSYSRDPADRPRPVGGAHRCTCDDAVQHPAGAAGERSDPLAHGDFSSLRRQAWPFEGRLTSRSGGV